MKIGNIKISTQNEPFIIAEMSGNHNKSLPRALEIVESAAKAGAHALKLQTYKPDTLTLNIKEGDFFISDKTSLWYGKSLYDLYDDAFTPWEWHEQIMKKAKQLGMLCFSSPFDETAVDYLEDLDVPAYKIASFENSHLPLIKKVISTRKPIIISAGLASLSELNDTIELLRDEGCENFALLKCTSSYPASPNDSNILSIPHMKNLFNCEIGLSDHTMGIGVAIGAIAHGATIIEKHFTLSRKDGGVDSDFSLEPQELKSLVEESKRVWQSLGSVKYGATKTEENSIIFRRSLYIAEDVKKGDTLNKRNLRIVRPGKGLPPKYFNVLVGKKVKRDLKKGTPVNWEIVL